MGSTRYTLAHQVHTMAHIVQIVHTRNLLYMCFVVHKVWVCFDSSFYRLEIDTFFQFYIHHTAMNTCTGRNGHGQGILHAIDSTNSHRVSHATARTKVCIGNTLRSNGFQQCANNRITSRVPTGRDNGYRTIRLGSFTQRTAKRSNLCMYIETINSIDTHSENLLGLYFYLTGRTCHDSHIDILQFGNVLYHFITCQLSRLVFGTITANNTCNFKIRSYLKRFHNRFTYITVTYYGCSNFLHFILVL